MTPQIWNCSDSRGLDTVIQCCSELTEPLCSTIPSSPTFPKWKCLQLRDSLIRLLSLDHDVCPSCFMNLDSFEIAYWGADKSSHCMEFRTATTGITSGNLRSKRGCSCSWKPQRIRNASVVFLFPCHFFCWSNTKIPLSKHFPLLAAWGHVYAIREKENYPNEGQVAALHVQFL